MSDTDAQGERGRAAFEVTAARLADLVGHADAPREVRIEVARSLLRGVIVLARLEPGELDEAARVERQRPVWLDSTDRANVLANELGRIADELHGAAPFDVEPGDLARRLRDLAAQARALGAKGAAAPEPPAPFSVACAASAWGERVDLLFSEQAGVLPSVEPIGIDPDDDSYPDDDEPPHPDSPACDTFGLETEGRAPPVRSLYELRRAAGKTLGDLARFLDCSVSDVSRLEFVDPADPMHVGGRCSCFGEGRCAWCASPCPDCGEARVGCACEPPAPPVIEIPPIGDYVWRGKLHGPGEPLGVAVVFDIRDRHGLPDPLTLVLAEGLPAHGYTTQLVQPRHIGHQLGGRAFWDVSGACDADVVAGDVSTVLCALEARDVALPEHVTYPEALQPYLGRDVWKGTLEDAWAADRAGSPLFAKPLAVHKAFTGHVVTRRAGFATLHLDEGYRVWLSEVVRFVAEHRVFVVEGVVEDVRRYRGDAAARLDFALVHRAVKDFHASGSAPAGYALDFGVTEDGRTLLVEFNDGYGLGHYGLDPVVYARLVTTRWREIVGGGR